MSFVFSHRTVNMVYKRVCRDCPLSGCGARYLVRLANHLADVHQLDYIQRRQYLQGVKLQPKLKSSFAKVKQIIQEKTMVLLWLAIEYRHKKRCTNCQDHNEMKRLLKQKLKEQLQRTSQTATNKGSRTVGSVRL